MATEYERNDRIVERDYPARAAAGARMGMIIGIMAALAVAAFLFFSFYDLSPRGTPETKSTPVTKTVPTTPTPTTK